MKKKYFALGLGLAFSVLGALTACDRPKLGSFTIVWTDDDGTVLETDTNVSAGTIPTYDGEIPTKDDNNQTTYTFTGWSPAVIEAAEDKVYVAQYTTGLKNIKINFDLNGGTSSKNIETIYKKTIDANDFAFDIKKTGYKFRGWSLGDEKVFNQYGDKLVDVNWASEMTFKALFDQNIEVKVDVSIPGAGSIIGEGMYEFDSNVDLNVITNEGYEFVGWFKDGIELSKVADYKFVTSDEDLRLTAVFSNATYPFTVSSYNPSLGSVMIVGEQKGFSNEVTKNVSYNSYVTVSARKDVGLQRFLGWFDENDQLINSAAVYSFKMPGHACALYAKWEANSSTVSVHKNIAEAGKVTGTGAFDAQQNVSLTAECYDGYVFLGWYSDSNYTTLLSSSTTYAFQMPGEDVELYAKFAVETFTITYNLNGGINSDQNPDSYTTDDEIVFENPTRDNYAFVGWKKGNTIITKIEKGSSGNVELTAVWKANKYTVTFDLQGHGTSVIDDQLVEYGAFVEEPSSPFQSGWTFKGWFKDELCFDEWLFEEDVVSGPLTLYASWRANSYTVTFDNNGHGIAPDPVVVNYRSLVEEPVSPSESGYTFTGWYRDEACEIPWLFEEDTVNKNLTLYAGWDINAHTVSFNSQGGSMVSNRSVAHGSTFTKPTNPTKEGYSFDGWYKEIDCINAWDFASDTVNSALTLFAKWTAKEYVVIHSATNGTVTVDSTGTYGEALHIAWDNDGEAGYNYGSKVLSIYGGTDNSGDLLEQVTSGNSYDFTMNGSYYSDIYVELIYTKTGKSFAITYKDEGDIAFSGNHESNYPTNHTYGLPTMLENNPTKAGYSFVGWYLTPDCSGTPITELSSYGYTSAITLYAEWNVTAHHVAIHSNDVNFGNVDISNVNVNHGTAYSTSGNVLTIGSTVVTATPETSTSQYNYTFSGWSVTAGQVNSDLVITATFERELRKYNIGISAENSGAAGSVSITSIPNVDYGTNMTVTNNTITVGSATITATPKANDSQYTYSFAGWTINGSQYASTVSGVNVPVHGPVTIVARFNQQLIGYGASFDMHGHGAQVASQSLSYGSKVVKPTDPTETGYTFDGWYTSDDYLTLWDFDNDTISDSTVLHAKWSPNAYLVTLDKNSTAAISGTPSVSASYNEDMPSATMATRNGYKFKGYWTSNDNGATLLIQYYDDNGASVRKWDQTNAATLYAKWEAIEYTITFQPNNGSSVFTEDEKYDSLITEPASAPIKNGYHFLGWDKDGSSLGLIDAWDFGVDTVDGTRTLYAKYEADIYDIIYNLDGGNVNPANPDEYTVESENIVLNDAEKVGHTFVGWVGSNGTTPEKGVTIAKGSTGIKEYTAQYTINSHQLSLYANGNGTVTGAGLINYGTSVTVVATPATNYYFDGWYDNSGCTGTPVSMNASYTFNMPDNPVTLYAKFAINSHVVTLPVVANGTVSGGGTYSYGDSVTVTATPDTDYIFRGWFTDSSYTSAPESTDASYTFNMPDNPVTLYAKFTLPDYPGETPRLITAGNPTTRGNIYTYDIIEYGCYPQDLVTDPSTIAALEIIRGGENNYSAYQYDGNFYIYYSDFGGTNYFKFQPIEWRVASQDNTTGYYSVVSEYALDLDWWTYGSSAKYSSSYVRHWLNAPFNGCAVPTASDLSITNFWKEGFINNAFDLYDLSVTNRYYNYLVRLESDTTYTGYSTADSFNTLPENDYVGLLSNGGTSATKYTVRNFLGVSAASSINHGELQCKATAWAHANTKDVSSNPTVVDGYVDWWIRWTNNSYSTQNAYIKGDNGRLAYLSTSSTSMTDLKYLRPFIIIDMSGSQTV